MWKKSKWLHASTDVQCGRGRGVCVCNDGEQQQQQQPQGRREGTLTLQGEGRGGGDVRSSKGETDALGLPSNILCQRGKHHGKKNCGHSHTVLVPVE